MIKFIVAISLILCGCLSFAAPNESASPILVELFTSEGCSSCPPADALLQKLDQLQPIPGSELIVMGEHVTYWNHDGWVDRYSSDTFTNRQAEYVQHLRLPSSYTPQMVIDGTAEVLGSDSTKIVQKLQAAHSDPKLLVRISSISLPSPKVVKAQIDVDALPESFKTHSAEVYFAVALQHAESQVEHGENGGKHLSHVDVALALNKVGKVDREKGFSKSVEVKLPSSVELKDIRVIAFVQQPGPGKVLGGVMRSGME